MNQAIYQSTLRRFWESEEIYKRVCTLSDRFFDDDNLTNTDGFVKEAELLLGGLKGTDTVMGIFNHKTWLPILEAGADEFWGQLPANKEDRIKAILSYLEDEYATFPIDSVKWQIRMLNAIPYEHRVNFRFHHCGIRYKLPDGKRICIFSQGMPLQYNKERHFNYTFNYVQNISHLMKKEFSHYWIRMAYGLQNEFVRTYHSATGETVTRDLLSSREKEILHCIADDLDTRQIADRLSISPNTVGNHRSNMIERLGVRDTTALVQLAKMTTMI